jgi:hypothetical protein
LTTFVTLCYKDYSITNSNLTKVVHRYLSQEVSELLVLYPWLVLPFHMRLKLHTFNSKEPDSSYLRATNEPREAIAASEARKVATLLSWDRNRLSKVLKQKFKVHQRNQQLELYIFGTKRWIREYSGSTEYCYPVRLDIT